MLNMLDETADKSVYKWVKALNFMAAAGRHPRKPAVKTHFAQTGEGENKILRTEQNMHQSWANG